MIRGGGNPPVSWTSQECLAVELALGRHAAVVAELSALVAEHPLREEPRARLMLALYRCGRRPEALEAYREGRALLVEETGLEPTARLRTLHEEILRGDAALRLPEPSKPAAAPVSAPAPAPTARAGPRAPGSGGDRRAWAAGPDWVSSPPVAVPAAFFGTTVGSGSGAMHGFRVGAVRFWDSGTRWSNVQPRRDVFDWSALDRMVAGARAAGLPATYTMGITPAWAAPGSPRSAYSDGSRTAPPRDLTDWDRYPGPPRSDSGAVRVITIGDQVHVRNTLQSGRWRTLPTSPRITGKDGYDPASTAHMVDHRARGDVSRPAGVSAQVVPDGGGR
ncbi:MAG: BTAD domain-containing putative transcriptional regulator [Spirillospora sp.]